ncbi:hypothetical protein GDO81_006195 [Engystomops pustulosus]|uniref:Fibrinogen C-terminal domain-containing protein n=1 Tax=Engystomops pustulosus TaxID=76066 RepID=A0AAV7CW76_ENGPU|nr:hypothetical protein GDO81_006195 [Engystomops pustulosus]
MLIGYDCADVWLRNHKAPSGLYWIQPKDGNSSFQVYCEMSKYGGRTLIQRHDGTDRLSFYKTWKEYENGFGQLQGEHWLGLKKMYDLTHQTGRPASLYISMGDFDGEKAYALYSPFSIGRADEYYKLMAGNYSGTAGDAFSEYENISGSNQHGRPFSTLDVVKDNCHPYCPVGGIMEPSCSDLLQAGWWFNACGFANLNGVWRDQSLYKHWTSSVAWPTWRWEESLKFSRMYLVYN